MKTVDLHPLQVDLLLRVRIDACLLRLLRTDSRGLQMTVVLMSWRNVSFAHFLLLLSRLVRLWRIVLRGLLSLMTELLVQSNWKRGSVVANLRFKKD